MAKKPQDPKDIAISKLQSAKDYFQKESQKVKARLYDYEHKGEPAPAEADLKAQVVSLNEKLKSAELEIAKYQEKLKERAKA